MLSSKDKFIKHMVIEVKNTTVVSASGEAKKLGQYSDNVILIDKKIDDNKQGLRNGLAQQLLHEQMVEMQYQQ